MNLPFKSLVFVLAFLFTSTVFAGEGMWLPQLLKALNEGDMQTMGMKLTAEDIYSVNKGSLKDAIVHFNRGCTSEIISAKGLLLTNHHCGYSQIQSHSTLEKNYLKDGFWAKDRSGELANPGLTATLIARIDDVTKAVLKGVTDDMSPKERQAAIDINLEAVKSHTNVEAHQEVMIRPFYKGNQYFLFVTVTYTDVRLVGTPPESIGKFGSDTDNWVWPRHTGDFSIFRIYANKDNMPADYAEDNVPYTPKHFLPISLDGIEEGDFSMVFGFPGRTDQYLPSFAVEQIVDVLNPARIEVRDHALKIVGAAMRADEATRLQYASKFARIANYWKKWIGEKQGLETTDGVGRKKRFEAEYLAKAKEFEKNKRYKENMAPSTYLDQFEKLYKERESYALARDYHNEITGRNIEVMQVAGYHQRLIDMYKESGEPAYTSFKGRLNGFLQGFYKNYQPSVDQKVFADLIQMYVEKMPFDEMASVMKDQMGAIGAKDYNDFAAKLYEKSLLTSQDMLMVTYGEEPDKAVAKLADDPIIKLNTALNKAYGEQVTPKLSELQDQINELQRKYMKAIIELFPDRSFYPDANGTMRVSYGKINGYQPRDAVSYLPVTYLSGVVEKYVPDDYEFDVPAKLLELYEKKDYGDYADNGKMPVCFIGSNHTTGGNSGSPAIDAHGNLIGLNFDRVWEGTMSDINYDKSICRNIMVDARYILFIIDKFAGADHLIKEMKLVHPKK